MPSRRLDRLEDECGADEEGAVDMPTGNGQAAAIAHARKRQGHLW